MDRLTVFGETDDRTRAQIDRCLDASGDSSLGVLCADNHLGYGMPIGGVVASDQFVMPAGVGFDIGCGNAAVRTNLQADEVPVARIMDEIWDVLSFGVGRKNNERVDHHVLDDIAHSPIPQQRGMVDLAAKQIGTIGSGNHYIDLFKDRADGRLWVGVHFGSRGFGHKTASGFLALASGEPWGTRVNDSMDAVPVSIPLGTTLAEDYLKAMVIAGEYAYAGRNWVVDRVLKILGAGDEIRVHNHHNFAWWEYHDGRQMLVTRKGATPAFPGQLGFVGGSMGDDAVIVSGVESDASQRLLYSTVHGAGRAMSRSQAAGKVKRRQVWKCGQRSCDYWAPVAAHKRGDQNSRPTCPKCAVGRLIEGSKDETLREGVVNWPEWQTTLKAQGVELRGAGADEAPQCYKRLNHVLSAHAGTIDILYHLQPIGVAMAGPDVEDPFRD